MPKQPSAHSPHSANIRVEIDGGLRVFDRMGKDCTPRLRRAQALLAVLSISPMLRRPRAWLQACIWSDHSPDKAAAGLRYALWSLRQALGRDRKILEASADWIGLNRDAVDIIADPKNTTEIFAGLDGIDPELDTILRDERLRHAEVAEPTHLTASTPVARAVLLLAPVQAESSELAERGATMLAAIGSRVARSGGARVMVRAAEHRASESSARQLRLNLISKQVRKNVLMHLTVYDARREELLWTQTRTFERPDSFPLPGDPFVGIAAERIVELLSVAPPEASEAEHAQASLVQMLRFPRKFEVTDLKRSALYLQNLDVPGLGAMIAARRALLLNWLVIEREVSCQQATLDEADQLVRQALERDPASADTLCVAAELLDFGHEPTITLDFAQRALAIDPSDPLVIAAHAKALARVGAVEDAYHAAKRAKRLASGSFSPAWWSMLCCVTGVGAKDYAGALRHARTAHTLDPNFRVPLRFIAILRYLADGPDAARDALDQLSALEPGFTPSVMGEADYPIRSFDRGVLQRLAQDCS